MKKSERMILKERLKRLGIFCLIFFIPAVIIVVLLMYAKIPQGWNIVITVVILFVFFGLYLYICQLLDKRKEKRMKESGKKDPFSE